MTAVAANHGGKNGQTRTCNHHCSVVIIGGFGVLIEGSSGSGKTSLALGLLDACRTRGIEAILVTDDQALLTCNPDDLKASVPAAIQGKAEVRGYGIVEVPFRESATVHLIARLVDDKQVQRMPEGNTLSHIGELELPRPVPVYDLPRCHEAQGIRIVMAALENCFGLRP